LLEVWTIFFMDYILCVVIESYIAKSVITIYLNKNAKLNALAYILFQKIINLRDRKEDIGHIS